MKDSTQIEDINKDYIVVSELKDKHSVSRTTIYWLHYMYYIHVVKMLIYAERTGN